ncbi:hypothetical protein TNCT_712501, partial [Trichonephila clavata]
MTIEFPIPPKPASFATPTFSIRANQSGCSVSMKASQHQEPNTFQYGTEERFAFQFPNDDQRQQ